MRIYVLASVSLILSAQDIDPLREQLLRVNPNPVTDLSDPASRTREILRLPLTADRNASLAEIQSAQNTLHRLNDLLNADAERAAQSARQSTLDTLIMLRDPLLRPSYPASKITPRPPVSSLNLALAKPTRQSSLRYFPSRGGVDGRITGTYGFDTELEANPWWDVDLQQSSKITEIRVYNSRISPEHARTLQVLLSDDGETWKLVYSHNRTVFGADGQPLLVPLKGTPARWVRLQLAETNYFHLDEIEVYAAKD